MAKKDEPQNPLSPEISKLIEKVGADPKSRLFLSLAEEYLKSGMTDEAAMVLEDGLKNHPGFHAARVALGKVFLEMGKIPEAKAEFEQVLSASPDNLMAHRKLAPIYKDEGQLEKARRSCQAVLGLNPKDAEMLAILGEVEGLEQAEKERYSVSADTGPSEKMEVEQTSHLGSESSAEPGLSTAPEDNNPLPLESHTAAGAESEPTFSPSPSPPAPSLEPVPSLEDILGEVSGSAGPTKIPAGETVPSTPASPPEYQAVAPSNPPEMASEALGDLYIKQGHFDKGIAIFRQLLAENPGNQALFKKLGETIDLAKLLEEGPKIQPPSAKAGAKPASPETDSKSPSFVPESPAGPEREQLRDKKIRRLQDWLENIKKGKSG